jgi:nucleoside-diphosphate-sugar epimerase
MDIAGRGVKMGKPQTSSTEQNSLSSAKASVFLTGANGFVGRAVLRRLLAAGFVVTVGGRRRPESNDVGFVALDLSSPFGMKEALADLPDFDFVIHAAGSLRGDCDAVNHLGTRALLDHLGARAGRWIQLGSAGVYRNSFRGTIDETMPVESVNEYETSKLLADEAVREVHPNAVILRPTMVAGPGMKGSPLRLLARGLRAGVVPAVEAEAFLNLVNVEDVAAAILHVCERPPDAGAEFILSDDVPLSSCLELLALEIRKSGSSFRLPRSLVRMAARAGSLLGLEIFNTRRLAILENRVRFDAGRFRQFCPGWPQTGSPSAISEFARSQYPPHP